MKKVRIGAYSLTSENAEQIVQQAEASGVYGIEVDNDIPGRYESLLAPSEKLEAIRRVAEAAHRAKNKAFVYVAGFRMHVTAPCRQLTHLGERASGKWLQRKDLGRTGCILIRRQRSGLQRAKKMRGSVLMQQIGANYIWNGSARYGGPPASMASMSIFRTG